MLSQNLVQKRKIYKKSKINIFFIKFKTYCSTKTGGKRNLQKNIDGEVVQERLPRPFQNNETGQVCRENRKVPPERPNRTSFRAHDHQSGTDPFSILYRIIEDMNHTDLGQMPGICKAFLTNIG